MILLIEDIKCVDRIMNIFVGVGNISVQGSTELNDQKNEALTIIK